MSETILETAGRLTSGDRNKSYGHPLDDYNCTGALFTALLRHAGKLRDGAVIEPELAQALMIAVKLSRLSGNLTHRDSLIDICGYARTIEMTQHERAVRAASPEAIKELLLKVEEERSMCDDELGDVSCG